MNGVLAGEILRDNHIERDPSDGRDMVDILRQFSTTILLDLRRIDNCVEVLFVDADLLPQPNHSPNAHSEL